jgi:hypothetical protein
MGDAGPEIRNGLGVFLFAARSKLGVGRASALQMPSSNRAPRLSVSRVNVWPDIFTFGSARDGLL